VSSPLARPLSRMLVRERRPMVGVGLWLSFTVSLAIVLAGLAISDACHHWFVIPVLLCGTLAGVDALRWLRGQVDLFDPVGILGMIGWHVFFLAPLLHVIWDWWMPYVVPPDDWRPWVGDMAWLNLMGWSIYLLTRGGLEWAFPQRPSRTIWRLQPDRFVPLLLLILAGSAALQLYVYGKFGGLVGYMQATIDDGGEGFTGMSYTFVFSEAFPIPAMIAAAWWARKSPSRRTWLIILALFAGFFALKLFFGGLRGLRGHTIYGLFWAAGIVHFTLRPLPKKLIALAGALLMGFMYFYLFYKSYGPDAVRALNPQEDRSEMLASAHRSFAGLALGDLGRTDVQAFLLYRMSPEGGGPEYEPAWGRTYLGAIALLLPRSLFPDRPLTKFKEGTDALFGPGVYEREFVALNAYGIVGEAMLNFGALGIPLAFAAMGGLVVATRRTLRRYALDDSRRYLVPFVISLSFMIFIWDSDIIVFYLFKDGLIPALLVLGGSCKEARPAPRLAEVSP
jgi:hypothetical protein